MKLKGDNEVRLWFAVCGAAYVQTTSKYWMDGQKAALESAIAKADGAVEIWRKLGSKSADPRGPKTGPDDPAKS